MQPQESTLATPYLSYGVLCSVLIHLLLILCFLQAPSRPASIAQVFNVEFEPPATAKPLPAQRQIVSEPAADESAEAPETQLLAEKNHKTAKEQIKRGDSPDAGLPNKMTNSQPKRKVPPIKQETQQERPLKNLKLDSSTLLKQFAQAPNKATEESTSQSQPFSRPSGSGAAFVGRTGLSDFIPSLPDGDLTLLNTKADQYAVFVRRVATQVFAQLRLAGWDTLRPADITSISRDTYIRAVLSSDGALQRVELVESSGSPRFDDTVVAAAKRGAKDPNPPSGAMASDGTIRFIFKSRSWVRYAAAARNGAPIERRWLLLGTGLE
jgi:TonB family protein